MIIFDLFDNSGPQHPEGSILVKTEERTENNYKTITEYWEGPNGYKYTISTTLYIKNTSPLSKEDKIKELQNKLNEEVELQNYENAAKIRDAIKKLENNV